MLAVWGHSAAPQLSKRVFNPSFHPLGLHCIGQPPVRSFFYTLASISWETLRFIDFSLIDTLFLGRCIPGCDDPTIGAEIICLIFDNNTSAVTSEARSV